MEKNMSTVKYRHTGITVNDMEKSVWFYKEILGFKIIQDFWDDSDYISKLSAVPNARVHMIKMQTDYGFLLELLKYHNHPTKFLKHSYLNVGLCHMAFQIKDANLLYNKLKKNNIRVLSKPLLSSEGFAKVFFCLDPNNIRIELVEII